MELQKDSLVKLVKAARASTRITEDTKKMLRIENMRTAQDDISEFLADVLFDLSGEVLRFDQDFMRDSKTMKLIRSDLSDEEVVDEFEWMHTLNKEVEESDTG